jgi:hypothetical protein
MVGAKPSLSQASTKYWVDVILTTSGHWKRFGCERDALAHAQVYARFPYACSVVGLRPDTRRAEDHLRVERSRMKHERSTAIPPQRASDMTQAYSKPERRDPQVRGNVVYYIPTALGTRVRFAIITLARREAREAVKRQSAGRRHQGDATERFRDQHAC